MMNEIYNKWWVSVREFTQDTNSKEVDRAIKIITDYVATNFDDYPIARKLVLAYIDELMARTNGGYISQCNSKKQKGFKEMTKDAAVVIVKNNIDKLDERLVSIVARLILKWIELGRKGNR